MGLLGGLSQGALGTLFVKLSADATSLVKGFNDAEKLVGTTSARMIKQANAIGVAVGAMFAAVAGASALLVKKSIDAADHMQENAQIAGQSVKEFSALAHAAEMASVSQADLAMASKFLTQWMKETGRTSTNLTESLIEQADQFASMPDGPEKLAMAYDRFGRSGASMIPLLNQGSAAMREQMQEAQALGLVVSDKFGRDADQFNDNITKMQGLIRGLFNQIAEKLLPTWIAWQEAFIKWTKDADNQKKVVDNLVGAYDGIVKAVKIMILGVRALGVAFEAVATAIAANITISTGLLQIFADAFDQMTTAIANSIAGSLGKSLGRLAAQFRYTVDAITKGDIPALLAGLETIGTGLELDKVGADLGKGVKKALEVAGDQAGRAMDLIKGTITGAMDDIDAAWEDFVTFGDKLMNPMVSAVAAGHEEVTKHLNTMAQDSERVMKILDQMGKPRPGALDPFTQGGLDMSGEIKTTEENLRVLHNLLEEKKNITEEAQLAILETTAAYNAKLKELHMQEAVLVVNAAQNMFDKLASTTEMFAGKQSGAYKAMFAASKAFAIAESVVKIQQGIANALSLGWPLGLVAAASVVAEAAGIVSTIKSVQLEFGGAKAEGGPVTPGKAFLVGEQGPEMFTPNHAGHITPNDQLGGGGNNVKVIINNHTDARAEVRESSDADGRVIEVMIKRVKSELGSEIRDGRGDVNKALESSFGLRRGK